MHCSTCGKDSETSECATCEQWWKDNCAAGVAMIVELWPTSTAAPGRVRAAKRKRLADGQPPATLYVFRWNRCGRKGQTCKVTARGTMNSCRVEFDDGFVMVTSRNALMRATK